MEYSNLTGMDSVTTILGVYLDKSWFTDESCHRGSYVHDALNKHLMGIWSPPHPEEYQGYITSGKLWIDENIKDVLSVEDGNKTRMSDTVNRYSGQPDLICTLKLNPQPGITDWKTSIAFSVVWNGQISAYWNLAKKNGWPDVCWGASVRLRKSGKIALANFIKNLDLELQYFLNANAAYRRYKLKIT